MARQSVGSLFPALVAALLLLSFPCMAVARDNRTVSIDGVGTVSLPSLFKAYQEGNPLCGGIQRLHAEYNGAYYFSGFEREDKDPIADAVLAVGPLKPSQSVEEFWRGSAPCFLDKQYRMPDAIAWSAPAFGKNGTFEHAKISLKRRGLLGFSQVNGHAVFYTLPDKNVRIAIWCNEHFCRGREAIHILEAIAGEIR